MKQAKDKAQELVKKFMNADYSDLNFHGAKQCAIISVDEILNLVCAMDGKDHWQEFYEEVKQEIQKL